MHEYQVTQSIARGERKYPAEYDRILWMTLGSVKPMKEGE